MCPQVGLVSQEPALFNGTVLENVRIGKPEATMEEVLAACDVANARGFIERQPDGFATLLGEGGGISLSGACSASAVLTRLQPVLTPLASDRISAYRH